MKYIFIDSNQYRHLFSKNQGFSGKTKDILDQLISKQRIKLLIPQQVHDEVQRNRLENWYVQEYNDIETKISNKREYLEKKRKELTSFPKELKSISYQIEKDISAEQKVLKNIEARYRSHKSKAVIVMQQLFDMGELIEENDDIVNRARLRVEKGNPPQDNKLGDALIWESLLHFLANAPKGSTLIFVARDGNAWGTHGFNPWLAHEMKSKCGVTITLAESLSDIEELTKEEQDAIRKLEMEELKNNALLNFINSRSWVKAGENALSLLAYKNLLNKADYEKLVNASIANSEIYQSFFTSSKLNHLCRGENGFVVSFLEDINPLVWKRFVDLNQIELNRISDANNEITI